MTENTSDTNHNDNQKSSAYSRIGETLRKARKEAGLNKTDISRSLRLPGLVIDDIEHGRVNRLSALYRRGYIANYARLLGLEPTQLLAEVEFDEPPDLQQAVPVGEQGWKFDRYLRIATYVLVTTAIVPPLLYFFIEGGSRIMERDPVADSQPAIEAENAGEIEGGERNRQPSTQARDESEGSSKKEEVGHVSASAIPLAAVRPVDETELISGGADSELLLPAAELVEPEGASDELLAKLTIEVEADSWVEVHAADGARLEYDLLRAGQKRDYQGKPPFQLLLGQANAVRVMLDDEAVTYDGHDRGDVARFELLANGEVQR